MSDSQGTYDVEAVRSRFPIFSREVHGQPLCYLDSGASAQQPDVALSYTHLTLPTICSV